MIHVEPFQHDCTIEEVEVFAGGDGTRPLRIGVFRREGTTMEFTLIASYDAINVPVGKSTVRIYLIKNLLMHVLLSYPSFGFKLSLC